MITIYTDGSCDTSVLKTGGWAAILIDKHGREKEVSGAVEMTTSNRMELLAILQALFVLSSPQVIKIITDSNYVVQMVNKGYLEKMIKTEEFDRPHFELWKMLYNLMQIHKIEFEWIKGHSGNEYNERCDKLASEARKELIDKILKEKGKSLFDLEPEDLFGNSLPFENSISNDELIEEDLIQEEIAIESKPTKKKKKKKSTKPGYYAVARGREVGVYRKWTECQKQINKYPGCRFKKFDTKEEAEMFIKNNR